MWVNCSGILGRTGRRSFHTVSEYVLYTYEEGLCPIVGETKPMFMSPEALDFCQANCMCVFMDFCPFFTHSLTPCPFIRPHPLRHPSFYSLSTVNLKPYSRSSSTFCPASILNSKINYVVVVTIPFKLRNQLRRGLMGTKKLQCLDKGCNNC